MITTLLFSYSTRLHYGVRMLFTKKILIRDFTAVYVEPFRDAHTSKVGG